MELNNCSTALFVKDIEISKQFYIGILGLSVNLDFGKNVIFKNGFAIWEISENHIIPSTLGLDKLTDSSVNRMEIYFETENLSQIFKRLKQVISGFCTKFTKKPGVSVPFAFSTLIIIY